MNDLLWGYARYGSSEGREALPAVGEDPPSWSMKSSLSGDGGIAYLEDARGWPMVSMVSFTAWRYDEVADLETLEAIRSGIVVGGGFGPFCPTVLPFRPILGGFAVDSLLYGAIAYAVLFAWGDAWRWRRKRLGLCRNCGYELHGKSAQGCPECGWRRGGP